MNNIIGNAMDEHRSIPEKVIKFNKHKYQLSRWITKGIVNSTAFRNKLYYWPKNTAPYSLEH